MYINNEAPVRVTMEVEEVSLILGIGRDLAYKLCSEGHFKVKRVGRRVLVIRQSFEEWLNNGEMYSAMRRVG